MKVFLEKVALIKIIFIIFFISCAKNLSANDKSLSFDGTDDFVEIVNNAALNPTGAYTVAAWFKQEGETTTTPSQDSWQSIITSRSCTGGCRGYMMYIKHRKFEATASNLEYWHATTDPTDWVKVETTERSAWKRTGTAAWEFNVIRFNGTDEIDFFLNGSHIGNTSSTVSMNNQNTDKPTRIGAGRTEGAVMYLFKGKIDDVAIWDEALTNAEITELYNNGESLYAKENYGDYTSKDNLTAYYTMDSNNGSGTTLSDDEGSNDGSFNGAPTWSSDTPGTAPTITSFTPTDDSTFVDVNTNLVLNFSEIVRGTSSGNVTIKKASDNSVVEVIAGNSDKVSGSLTTQITINPSTTLDISV